MVYDGHGPAFGRCDLVGVGVAKYEPRAVELFKLAAEQGNPEAQYHLGLMLEHGIGGRQDRIEAQKYFQIAEAHGFKKHQDQ